MEGLSDLWQVTDAGINIFESLEKDKRELQFEGIMRGVRKRFREEIYRHSGNW